MSLCSKIKVVLPKNGITIRRSHKYATVFKVVRNYRNEKGTPTNKRVAIGKLDETGSLLIPNNNYWELYPNTTIAFDPKYKTVRSIGVACLVEKILEKLGIKNILIKTFGQLRADLIHTAVLFMVSKGNVFENVMDFCEENTLHETPLFSQKASELFASITYDERTKFFKEWIALQKVDSYWAYDVTSLSTYSKGIKEAEMGYNRDKEKLPQINVGCFTSQDSGLPIYYVSYPGSIVDKSHLKYMMSYNKEFNVKNLGFVLDRGFCTTGNVKFLDENNYAFVLGVELGQKTVLSAVNACRGDISEVRWHIGDNNYGKSVQGLFYGIKSTVHVYFDPVTRENQRGHLFRTVEMKETELSNENELTNKRAKEFRKYFDITLNDDKTFSYTKNWDKIQYEARNLGYFCILTNTNLSSKEVLSIYRRKDVIEKNFDEIKNRIDMKRIRTHQTETTEGKLFCSFISLIVSAEMGEKLRNLMTEKSWSKDGVITELEKIKLVTIAEKIRGLNPMTKNQKLIYERFGLTEDDLNAYISRD
jgi:transposase